MYPSIHHIAFLTGHNTTQHKGNARKDKLTQSGFKNTKLQSNIMTEQL